MRFFVNLDTGAVTNTLNGSTPAAPEFKFQSITPIEVQFHRDGIPERLGADDIVQFAFKETGKFDTAPAASIAELERPDDDEGFYSANLNTNTEGCAALIGADENLTNDSSSKNLGCEFAWLIDGDELPTKSKTFSGSLKNSVIRAGDATPIEPPPTRKLARTAITNGATTVAVVFSSAFEAAPKIPATPCVEKGNAGHADLFCTGISGLSASGFTAHLSAAAPNGNYHLHWIAYAS